MRTTLGKCTEADPLKGIAFYHRMNDREYQGWRMQGFKIQRFGAKSNLSSRYVSEDGRCYRLLDIEQSAKLPGFIAASHDSRIGNRMREAIVQGKTIVYAVLCDGELLWDAPTWLHAFNSMLITTANGKHDRESLEITVVAK